MAGASPATTMIRLAKPTQSCHSSGTPCGCHARLYHIFIRQQYHCLTKVLPNTSNIIESIGILSVPSGMPCSIPDGLRAQQRKSDTARLWKDKVESASVTTI